MNSKSLLSALALFCALCLPSNLAAKHWLSATPLTNISENCPSVPANAEAINRLKQQIITANSVNAARSLALAPTDLAIDAIQNARLLMPFNDDLTIAEGRLNQTRSRIETANSQVDVANELSGMMLAGLDNDRAAHVDVGKVGCDYSSGEVIAIVVGLILGIIPGLILLAVLC